MCYVGWTEEGCGDSPRYMPAVINDIQDDTFDEKYVIVFLHFFDAND